MDNIDLQNQLLEAFKTESRERLQSLFLSLAEMEKNPAREDRLRLIEVVFREAHSLKGAARSVNLPAIEAICQAMEGIFSDIKEEKLALSARMFDTLHASAGCIERYLAASPDDLSGLRGEMEELTRSLYELKAVPGTQPPAENKLEKESLPKGGRKRKSASSTAPHPRPLFSETVRIPTAKLDRLLLKAEELIALKQILNRHLDLMKDTGKNVLVLKKQWEMIKPEIKKIEKFSEDHNISNRFLQAFESGHKKLEYTSDKINRLIKAFEQSNRLLGGMADDLLDEMKKASLLPFSTLFAILPPMVREIAGKHGKEIDIEFSGEDIEIDKRILDNIKDPLIHLLRNAVDHGIEAPKVREQNQKPRRGLIRVVVSQPENNKVKLKISDDGRGIDTPAIIEKARQEGILSPEQISKLKDADAQSLIFRSGVSTSPIITEISGRGLGMAIVKEGIEGLGGSISINSIPGSGTIFTLQLPVTIATFRCILVAVAGHFFLIPNTHVMHSLKIGLDDIKTVENRAVISINGRAVSLINLADALGLPEKTIENGLKGKAKKPSLPIVILGIRNQQIAFVVDEIINEQEVLVKNLGKQLKRVPNISGAAILGTGRVVPVLNVNDLMKTSAGMSLPAGGFGSTEMAPEAPKSILVVEDSLTARTLLKNILEASGYMVKTAVNGEDGFNRLKAKPFDAVVTDVEMPRMNGFELTKKIRSDQSLADTPVVLVTNLDSAVDRERGIDAGADAYIVKSHFDQSNLLKVIERLI